MDRALNPDTIRLALGDHSALPSAEAMAEMLAQAELALLMQRPQISEDLVRAGWYLHAVASSKYALQIYGIQRQRAAFQVAGHVFDLLLQTPEMPRPDRLKYCFAAQVAYLRSQLDPNALAIHNREFGSDLREIRLLADFGEVALSCGIALLGLDVAYIYRVTDHLRNDIRRFVREWEVDSILATPFAAAAGVALGARDLMTFLIYGRTDAFERAQASFRGAVQAESSADDLTSRWVAAHLLNLTGDLERASVWTSLPPDVPPTVRRAFSLGYPKILTLWPPQLELFHGGPNPLAASSRRLFLSTPTSGGKTALAQLLIASHLATEASSVCYVAPTRSLCREVKRSLEARLRLLGSEVLDGLPEGDWLLDVVDYRPQVEVMTPERLSYLIRANGAQILDQFGLFIFDEVHLVGERKRGWTLEQDLTFLHYATRNKMHRIALISAAIGNRNHFIEWLNQDSTTVIQLHSEWRGPRRLHTVWTTEVDWNSPMMPQLVLFPDTPHDVQYDVYGRLDALVSHSGHAATIRTSAPIGTLSFHVDEVGARERDDENSTPYYVMLVPLIRHLGRAGPVLIVESTRPSTVRMAQAIAQAENSGDASRIQPLIDLVTARLGAEHPLGQVLRRGVAYHHGSLPMEIRAGIEDAVAQGQIRYLVATTTMTEGVNLPVRSVVIAAQGSYSTAGYVEYIRGPKLVNAIGRAGRATKENEGIVVLARRAEMAPEDFEQLKPKDDDIQVLSMMATDEGLRDLAAFEELRRMGQDAIIQQGQGDVADFLSFVWFVASALEELGETSDLEHLSSVLEHTLGWKQLEPANQKRWLDAAALALARYQTTDAVMRKRWALAGMSLRSANDLQAIVETLVNDIIAGALPQTPQELIKLALSNDRLEMLLKLPEAPDLHVFATRAGRNRVEIPISIDGMLIGWVNGAELTVLANSHFGTVTDPDYRHEQLGDFVNNYFEVFFPWVLSVIVAWTNEMLAEKGVDDRLTRALPAYVRWGVDNAVALELLVRGIQSRDLAIRVSRSYDEESPEDDVWNWVRSMSLAEWRRKFSASIPELRGLLEYARDQRSGPAIEVIRGESVMLEVETLVSEMPESSANLLIPPVLGPAPMEIRVRQELVGYVRSRDQADLQSLLAAGIGLAAVFSASAKHAKLALSLLDPEA